MLDELKDETAQLPEGNPFAEEAEQPEMTAEEEAEAAQATEADPEEKVHTAKTVALGTFQKRVGKLVSQRNQERDRADAAVAEAASLKGALSQSRLLSDAVQKAYRGDVTQMAWDAKFLAEMEAQSARDPEVARVAAAVQASMKEKKPVTETNPTLEPKNETTAVIDKLAAKSVTAELLSLGVSPEFAAKIAKDSVAGFESADLVDLDRSGAVKLTKNWLAENGFKSEQILAKKAPVAEPKAKLNLGGGSGKAADEPNPKSTMKAPMAGRAAALKPAEARASFEDRRSAAFADFAADFNSQD